MRSVIPLAVAELLPPGPRLTTYSGAPSIGRRHPRSSTVTLTIVVTFPHVMPPTVLLTTTIDAFAQRPPFSTLHATDTTSGQSARRTLALEPTKTTPPSAAGHGVTAATAASIANTPSKAASAAISTEAMH